MKNKKIAALFLAAAISIGGLAATAGTGTQAVPAYPGRPVIVAQAASAPSASTLAKAVKKAYGDDYVPNVKLGKDEIKNKYGVSSAWYSSAYAEVPLMSVHVDELVIFRAKNASSKKKILKAVKEYQAAYKKSTMQYPMNAPKIQACKVYTNGNYVCFFMLGQISSSLEDNGTDEQKIQAFQKQNAKAVNAVKKKLK